MRRLKGEAPKKRMYLPLQALSYTIPLCYTYLNSGNTLVLFVRLFLLVSKIEILTHLCCDDLLCTVCCRD